MYNQYMYITPEHKEIYRYDNKRSLVMNEATGEICMQKTLTHYDESVYSYLSSNREKHIPAVYSYAKDDNGNLIVIEEFVQGDSFDAIINDRSMNDNDKLRFFLDLLEGLSFLHSAPQPIIHRDLKPSNIMVSNMGEIKILDYDAAKTYKPDSNDDTTHLGTVGVAAPEQYGFMQSDPRSDVYAVGKMLKTAFPNNSKIQVIADKATSFDPNNRYSNASELSDALSGKISPKMKLKPLFPPPGFRTRKWWKIVLAAAFYPFALYIILGLTLSNGPLLEEILDKIFLALFVFIAIDICNSWTGIFDILPFTKHKNFFVRYPAKLIFVALAAAVLMVMLISCIGIVNLFV